MNKDRFEFWVWFHKDFFYTKEVVILEKTYGKESLLFYIRLLLFTSATDGKFDLKDYNLLYETDCSFEEASYFVSCLKKLGLVENNRCVYISNSTVSKKLNREFRNRSCSQYKTWRNSVFKRDNYTCKMCGKRGVKLNAHHIKEWSKYPNERFKLKNGMTLCVDCHKKIHKKRRYA